MNIKTNTTYPRQWKSNKHGRVIKHTGVRPPLYILCRMGTTAPPPPLCHKDQLQGSHLSHIYKCIITFLLKPPREAHSPRSRLISDDIFRGGEGEKGGKWGKVGWASIGICQHSCCSAHNGRSSSRDGPSLSTNFVIYSK